MSVIELNAARENAKQIRQRLMNPPNMRHDHGITMVNGTPLPPPDFVPPQVIAKTPEPQAEVVTDEVLPIVIQWPSTSQFMTARIIRMVAKTYGVTATDVVSDRRTQDVVRPRQIAMFLVKTQTQRSLPWIGRQFGNRDHTTVLHAVNKIERLRKDDAELDAQLQQFAALIRPQEVT